MTREGTVLLDLGDHRLARVQARDGGISAGDS